MDRPDGYMDVHELRELQQNLVRLRYETGTSPTEGLLCAYLANICAHLRACQLERTA